MQQLKQFLFQRWQGLKKKKSRNQNVVFSCTEENFLIFMDVEFLIFVYVDRYVAVWCIDTLLDCTATYSNGIFI